MKAARFATFIVTALLFLFCLLAAADAAPVASPTALSQRQELYKRDNPIKKWFNKWRQNKHRNTAMDRLEGRRQPKQVQDQVVTKWLGSLPNRGNAMAMANSHIDAKKAWDQKRARRQSRQ